MTIIEKSSEFFFTIDGREFGPYPTRDEAEAALRLEETTVKQRPRSVWGDVEEAGRLAREADKANQGDRPVKTTRQSYQQ